MKLNKSEFVHVGSLFQFRGFYTLEKALEIALTSANQWDTVSELEILKPL